MIDPERSADPAIARRYAWGWGILLAMWVAAVKWGGLTGMDHAVAAWMDGIRSPALDTAARAITFFGSTPWAVAMAAVMLLQWRARDEGSMAKIFLLAWAGGLALQVALRFAVGQLRPDAIIVINGPTLGLGLVAQYELRGFPSGHAFRAAFLYGWWSERLTERPAGFVAAVGCGFTILLVGLTRAYLSRHWMTDIVGAWLLALMVLSWAEASRRSSTRFGSLGTAPSARRPAA